MLNAKYFPLRATFYFLISFAVYLGMLSFSNDQMNNGLSFLIASMAGVLSITVLFRLLRDVIGPKVYLYALFFFFFRLSIGALHYLYFFDGQYFQSSYSDFNYLHEYIWLYESMDIFQQGISGEMEADAVSGYAEMNKNYEMILFMSLLFLFGGTKVLTVATFNSLICVFTGVTLYLISMKVNNNHKNAFFCFLIVLLQPFEIITSILARDTFGQFIVIYSIFLVVFFLRSSIIKPIAIVTAGILSSFHREVYIAIPLVVGGFSNFFHSIIYHFRNFKKSNLILLFFILFFSLFALQNLMELFSGRFLQRSVLASILMLPQSILYSLVGPFPWTQYFLEVPGYEFQIPQYLTAPFNLTMYLSFLMFIVNKRPSRYEFAIILFFLAYYFAGIIVYSGRYTVYYSIAVPLLALLDKDSSILIFFKKFFMIFVGFLILNLIYTI